MNEYVAQAVCAERIKQAQEQMRSGMEDPRPERTGRAGREASTWLREGGRPIPRRHLDTGARG